MPLDKAGVAAALDANISSIRSYLEDDEDLIERYRDAFRRLPQEYTPEEINAELTSASYPGALPTEALDGCESLIEQHHESDGWESHEAVNDWARELLTDVPMLATDGSEIPPTTRFNVPLAYVQAAWCLNHHTPDGDLERAQEGQLLGPMEVTRASGENGEEYRFVDGTLVGLHRYEHEAEVLIGQMERLAAMRDAGELESPPIVCYDGPLVVSFANPLRPEARDRYLEAMSRILAASQHNEVPLVGYVAGTNANELTKMTRLLMQEEFGGDRIVPDARILSEMMSPWGDVTVPFVCRRDGSVDALETTYEDRDFAFGRDVHFSYLKVPPGAGLDRLEFPGWMLRRDGPEGYETLYDYVITMVRAEAGVGRGYPEVLQQADTDAVLDQRDRNEFLRLLQNWAEANDVPLEWNAKALSKELRRR
jgi:hypothetical protein